MVTSRSWRIIAIACLLVVLMFPSQANAVTFGTVDTTHTYVGAIIISGSAFGLWCSGSLVSQRVFLTAGHCTLGLKQMGISIDRLFVSFSTNFRDTSTWRAVGGYLTHPDFDPRTVFNDYGALILAEPVRDITPGMIAPLGYLSALARDDKLRGATFSVLGYGLDEGFWPPDFHVGTVDDHFGYRKIASSDFQALEDIWLFMGGDSHTEGSGACFGDSGGPSLHDSGSTEFIVSVHSWGNHCNATSVDDRMDVSIAQGFLFNVISANS